MHKQVRVLLPLSVANIWAHTGEEPGKPTPGVCPTQVVPMPMPTPILMPASVTVGATVPRCRRRQEGRSAGTMILC